MSPMQSISDSERFTYIVTIIALLFIIGGMIFIMVGWINSGMKICYYLSFKQLEDIQTDRLSISIDRISKVLEESQSDADTHDFFNSLRNYDEIKGDENENHN